MNTLADKLEPLAVEVVCSEDILRVVLADGREISVPLLWFPRLQKATPEQKRNWRLIGGGVGFRWPDVDEDIAVDTLLRVERTRPMPA